VASLDNITYQNAFQMAEAKEKQAADGYERLASVYKNGSLPEVKMIEMETNLQQAKSALQIARKNLDDCNLYSPVEGLIGKRSIDPGMNMLSGITAFTIVSIDKMNVKIAVPENEISTISRGQAATVVVPALDNRTFSGTIEQKGVVANLLSHTYEIKIALENPGHKLVPGMLCNVSLHNSEKKNVIAISQQVVQKDGSGKAFVFVVDTVRKVALRRDIATGSLLDNGLVEVESGLNLNDQIIAEGYQKVSMNTPLQILR
jgi:RND family efflux transporter MFP subunit